MRTRYPVAVHLFFFQGQNVLLLRRFNTGWQDGNYSVPAGHVEIGESVSECAIREAGEEVGVRLERGDLSVVHVMNRKSEEQRIDFFFLVKSWSGEITNREPDKCDELAWYPMDALPANVIPYVREALRYYQDEILYSEFGW